MAGSTWQQLLGASNGHFSNPLSEGIGQSSNALGKFAKAKGVIGPGIKAYNNIKLGADPVEETTRALLKGGAYYVGSKYGAKVGGKAGATAGAFMFGAPTGGAGALPGAVAMGGAGAVGGSLVGGYGATHLADKAMDQVFGNHAEKIAALKAQKAREVSTSPLDYKAQRYLPY